MKEDKLKYKFDINKYILIPQNEISKRAQEKSFLLFETMQLNYIKDYNIENEENKDSINEIISFFIKVFLNGDSNVFKLLVGFEKDKKMSKFEHDKIMEDYNEMKKMKKAKKIKTFFMLDIVPYSNRRADCIVITNDYNIELYDVSVGKVAEKLKNNPNILELTESEQKQLIRKKKQETRIKSFTNKIKPSSTNIKKIYSDEEEINIKYFEQKDTKFFDINAAIDTLKKNKEEKVYIPGSLCFLTTNITEGIFIYFEFSEASKNPFFINSGNIGVNKSNILFLKENKVYIAVSKIYLNIYLSLFTPFSITTGKLFDDNKYVKQMSKVINKKNKGLWLHDKRTNKKIQLSYGILYKHIYHFMSLYSLTEYISFLINMNESREFHKNAYNPSDESAKNYFFFNI